jgi:hypothetical protein
MRPYLTLPLRGSLPLRSEGRRGPGRGGAGDERERER